MKNLAISACSIIALAACTTPFNSIEQAPQVAKESLPETPSMWAMVGEKVGSVEPGWIAKLDDDTLSAFVDEALDNNRDLQIAAANYERSLAILAQARASLLPAVNGTAGAGRSGTVQNSGRNNLSLGLSASWEVDIWGRISSAEQAAIASAELAEADYIFSQYSIAAAVAQAYFLVIEAGLQADVAQRTLGALTETDRIVNVQYEFGVVTAQDVSLTRTDLATTRSSLAAAKGAERSALRALEVLMGRYPAADLEIRPTLPEVPEMPGAGLPSELLERRPDIIAAERQVAVAFAAVDQAKAAKLPSLSLTGSLNGASSDLFDILDASNLTWQLASNLLAPLIDNGLRDAQIDQANAEQKQAISAYASEALTAFQEVENSLDQNAVLAVRTDAIEEATREANNALRIVNIRYQEGETDLLDVLAIQQRVFSNEAELVSLQRARLEEWITLNLALGGSWE